MSDAGAASTFVSPSLPTAGLQRYDLERAPLNLVPDTAASGWRKKLSRFAAGRRDQAKRGSVRTGSFHAASHRKDQVMSKLNLEAMLGALQKSVGEINQVGGDNRDELLAKSFKEFGEAVEAEVAGVLAKAAPAEEVLYKDLGTVGHVARLVHHMGQHASALEKSGAEVSPEVGTLLDQCMAFGHLALHKAVNEHCEPAEEDLLKPNAVLPDGVSLIGVPIADDHENQVVVKTTLPEDLAKLAVDPATIAERAVELSIEGLQFAGVPDQALTKIFGDGGELAKAFPPAKKKPDGGDKSGDAPVSEPGPSQDNSAGSGNAGDAGGSDADGGVANIDGGTADFDTSGDDPFTVMQRILAAAMIQMQYIIELVEGDGDGSEGGASDTGTDPNAQPSPAPSGVTKATGLSGLAKRMANGGHRDGTAAAPAEDPRVATLLTTVEKLVGNVEKLTGGQDELGKTVIAMGDGLKKILDLPLPAKGVSNTAHVQAAGVGPSDAELQKVWDGMSQEDRALILVRAAQKNPEPRFRPA